MRSILLTSAAALALVASAPAARADGPEVLAPAKSEGVVFEPGTPKLADVLAKAKAEGKPVFIDFSTEWCGWCRELEKKVFTQASVAEVMKALINVHIDAEKGEGPDLAKRYGVRGFPSLVVVDADGAEIDRIVGYMEPPDFKSEIERILRGDGTLASLRKKSAESPDDLGAAAEVAGKIARFDPTAAVGMCEKLLASPVAQSHEVEAKIRLEYAAALLGADKAALAVQQADTLLKDFADTPSAAHVGARVGGAFVAGDGTRALAFFDAARALAKEPDDRTRIEALTISVHKRAIAAALKRQGAAAGEDPKMLNEIAWTCFEQKVNVREALGWAKTAVEKSNRDPAILDTLANLLWISGSHAEAIETEVEASSKLAGPDADMRMKREFDANIAKWRAEEEAMKASGAVPMTPIAPAAPKPAAEGAK